MKKTIFIFIALFILSVHFSCGLDKKMKDEQKAKERKEKQRTDSILMVMKKDFVLERDSFREGMPLWIRPQKILHDRQDDYVYAYFEVERNHACGLHLVISSSEAKSVEGCIMIVFNVDGKICNLILQPDMTTKTETGYRYNLYSAYGIELLDSITDRTKNVKMRMTNLEEYSDRTLSKDEVHLLYLTYKYFKELDGQFEDVSALSQKEDDKENN